MKKLLTVLAIALCFLPVDGKGLKSRTVSIDTGAGSMRMIVLEPKESGAPVPGILWIHGGGYMTGGIYMVHVSCGKMLAERYGAMVVSPDYRLAREAPYGRAG